MTSTISSDDTTASGKSNMFKCECGCEVKRQSKSKHIHSLKHRMLANGATLQEFLNYNGEKANASYYINRIVLLRMERADPRYECNVKHIRKSLKLIADAADKFGVQDDWASQALKDFNSLQTNNEPP